MQTKDILKQPLNTEWVVVARTAYVRKTAVSNKQVMRNQAEKVTLHSYDTYQQTHWTDTDPNALQFSKTSTDRTKRFLVKDDVGVYRVVPASDFVDLYSYMAPLWVKQEADLAKMQQERAQKDEIRQQAIAQAITLKESYEESVRSSVRHLLGYGGLQNVTPDIRVNGQWIQDSAGKDVYQTEVVGQVSFTYAEFLRLMEKFNELQDA